jgi:hypothetical protein
MGRLREIMQTSWISAGVFSGIATYLDTHSLSAVLSQALPQSLILSAGLLFIPTKNVPRPTFQCGSLGISPGLILLTTIAIAGSLAIFYSHSHTL